MKFTTDGSVTQSGFSATYRVVPSDKETFVCLYLIKRIFLSERNVYPIDLFEVAFSCIY